MKLVEFKNWNLTVLEEAWGLSPFSKILKRDKTKDKEIALKEMLFIFYYCDIRSYYVQLEEKQRAEEIKVDIGLPDKWVLDEVIQEGIEMYEKNSQSVVEKLYKQSLKAASDIGDYLEDAKELLNERDKLGKPTMDISKITTALSKIPKLMADLKAAYKEVLKEQEELAGKKKGSREFNIFERGLEI
jgi:hypothetical protein